MSKKPLDVEHGEEKGTQVTQATIIAEMNPGVNGDINENNNTPKESTSAIQTHYSEIVAETGAPVVEKYLNKSLKDNPPNGDAGGDKAEVNEVVVESKEPSPPLPPPPPPVEFAADVHSDDWQKGDFPEPPKPEFDMDVAAEEATSELVNLVKEQSLELENNGIVNQSFDAADGTAITEL
ncbi:uncharacterized protein [Antedon mediterranea]|uniref:uncharacterized protein n=1 Tax=Antedon mediterranea TaxID=105859 RepID=UPI003AF88453